MRVVFGLSVMDQRVFRTVMRAADFIAGEQPGGVIETGVRAADDASGVDPSPLADQKLMIVGVLTEIEKFVPHILHKHCPGYTFAWSEMRGTQQTLRATKGDNNLEIIQFDRCDVNDKRKLPDLKITLTCDYAIINSELELSSGHHIITYNETGRVWNGKLSYVSSRNIQATIYALGQEETCEYLRDFLVGPFARNQHSAVTYDD